MFNIHPEIRKIVGNSENGRCPFCLKELRGNRWDDSKSPPGSIDSLKCVQCFYRFTICDRELDMIEIDTTDKEFCLTLDFKASELIVRDKSMNTLLRCPIPKFTWNDAAIKEKIKTLLTFS